ncbi:16S rRNA (guanine(527)-N(7))-methyltransferase RsmG [Pelagibacteraceae bacterium]|nr:16S rRNA (guanine(527)-N(7))-methyltransferase RsmG [Pelagibacteraceae bacterium]
MTEEEVYPILLNKLNFNQDAIYKLGAFSREVISYNKKYNLIAKSTIENIWDRHILDSAQLVKFIRFEDGLSLSDLGTGAGFPGIVLAIFNKNSKFHVKLYEKSSVKTKFLIFVCKKLNIKVEVFEGDYNQHKITSKYVISRAFKKLSKHINISREQIKVSHKLIILKGKNAEEEVKQLNKNFNYEYTLEESITDKKSKILIVNIKK